MIISLSAVVKGFALLYFHMPGTYGQDRRLNDCEIQDINRR